VVGDGYRRGSTRPPMLAAIGTIMHSNEPVQLARTQTLAW